MIQNHQCVQWQKQGFWLSDWIKVTLKLTCRV